MELLAPSGNISSALAALKAGADAIYLGGKSFSARASADNFSLEEIKEITDFAHSIGRKINVTLNTLLYQDEFMEAVSFANYLYSIGVDAIIVQDLGLAHYLHKTLPGLVLHASTQLNCHNLEEARALIKIGFKRIVLARECSLDIVKAVKDLGVEVEVFVHGALCVSYSGNCLMSSFIGNRSGNRGRCAQPCRMAYKLLEDGEKIEGSNFAISTKDLMTLDYVSSLVELGIDSLKIEGRLKSGEYIYQVTKAYRHALDAVFECRRNDYLYEDKKNLQKIFSRNFTKGFLFDESPFGILNLNSSSHQGERIGEVIKTTQSRVSIKLEKAVHRLDGIRFNDRRQFGLSIEKMFIRGNPVEEAKKGDIIELSGIEDAYKLNKCEVIRTKDYLLNKQIEDELKERIKVPVDGVFYARPNEEISLTLRYLDKEITVKGEKALVAEGTGTQEDRIISQLSKSGDYPYYIYNIDMDIVPCFIPVSMLNKLRNDAFESLKQSFISSNLVGLWEYQCSLSQQTVEDKIKAIAEACNQSIYCKNMGFETYMDGDNDCSTSPRVDFNPSFLSNKTIVNYIAIPGDRHFIASQYCNITNSYALDCYFEMGYEECILSLELDDDSISSMIRDFETRHGFAPNVGVYAYGKPDAMLLRSCPIGTMYGNKGIHCNRCHDHHFELKDRVGAIYTITGDKNCNTRVLLDRPIYLLDKIDELRNIGVPNIYLHFIDESDDVMDEVVMSIWNKENVSIDYTRGHYNKKAI